MAHRPFVTTPISGSGTVVIMANPGTLHQIAVTSAGTSIAAYDHPSQPTGRQVAAVGATTGLFTFDTPCANGLTLTVTGSFVGTVTTRQRRT